MKIESMGVLQCRIQTLRLEGGWRSSRPLDNEGCGQFGLKIRGDRAPPLDPPPFFEVKLFPLRLLLMILILLGGTWVNFCWVCAAGFSEPLTHHSLFCSPMVDPTLVTFGKIGNLRNYDGDSNGNVKKAIGFKMSKTTTLHVHHA